jgi:hypothetical protein
MQIQNNTRKAKDCDCNHKISPKILIDTEIIKNKQTSQPQKNNAKKQALIPFAYFRFLFIR